MHDNMDVASTLEEIEETASYGAMISILLFSVESSWPAVSTTKKSKI